MEVAATAAAAMLSLAALSTALYLAYYLLLALIGLPPPRQQRAADPRFRFALLVSAHDEELTIPGIIRSLLALDYPRQLFDFFVIADNCTDDTAGAARRAGARVLERFDPDDPGKGAALAWAFAGLRSGPDLYDAFCVFDADNRVDPAFLQVVNACLLGGRTVIQGYVVPKNPGESLLAGVSAIVSWSAHRLVQLPRARLGLSAVLGGTGFCVSTSVLREHPWHATSLTEDLEYQARLVLEGGRVSYAPHARVLDEKPPTASASWRQRLRWMQGYWQLTLRFVPRLLLRGLLTRSPRRLEMAAYLCAPPRSVLAVAAFGMFLLDLLLPGSAWLVDIPTRAWLAAWLAFSLLSLAVLPLERAPARVYPAVLYIPLFAVSWLPLLLLGFVRRGRREWSRTPHAPDPGHG